MGRTVRGSLPVQGSQPFMAIKATSSDEALEPRQRMAAGGAAAYLPLVYDELRRMAFGYLQGERVAHTLQPTALVNEAYVRLADRARGAWASKASFIAAAATTMRRVLVDHARGRAAQKRGGDRAKVSLIDAVDLTEESPLDFESLDEALKRLAALDPRQAQVVELRFFGGLTVDEAAEVLGVSPRTIEVDWSMARAWLRRELSR